MRNPIRFVLCAGVLVAALAGLTGASTAQLSNQKRFHVGLSGVKEVPPVETQAIGEGFFQLEKNGAELHYKIVVTGIDNVTMAHIHLGAAGHNGPVVVWLYPSEAKPHLIPGKFSGDLAEGNITAENLVGPLKGQPLAKLVGEIQAGNAYVNVHTQQHPEGEIRGQIE